MRSELGAADATSIAYSGAHKRLYVSDDGGDIRYIDVTSTSGAPLPFTKTGPRISALIATGNYLFAQFISATLSDAGRH